MYKVIFSENFDEELGKLTKKNKLLKKQAFRIVNLISESINHPSLRLHKLSGKNYWSF